ncbi:hypothetical protein Dret_0281 [Desulfohalobium retbaense DSM 5692]|uniref:Uncharacterized protein n=1 Tax=Desulfohalobium retbaense (strain ATCC 49708 / DSM 5692 / JCM 16813 / HR100) TaxID=485915 RepID=C8WZV8_DESRD|nr:hypothetical protein Dret_0281 [Desulfohalobium retbaense DSM 5692]
MACTTRPCMEDCLSAGESRYRLAAVRVDASQAPVSQGSLFCIFLIPIGIF